VTARKTAARAYKNDESNEDDDDDDDDDDNDDDDDDDDDDHDVSEGVNRYARARIYAYVYTVPREQYAR